MIYPAIIMLILATTLSNILTNDLATGNYLASTLLGALPLAFFPLMLFAASTIIAIITGSSWSTLALLTPIAIQTLTSMTNLPLPAYPSAMLMLFPVLGAIFSGAVCGDQISPISETTIMAATSCGAYPLDHAQTQFPYALPAIISSGIAFLLVGLLIPQGLLFALTFSLGIGLPLCLSMLYALNARNKRPN